jgi:hypothetical protein
MFVPLSQREIDPRSLPILSASSLCVMSARRRKALMKPPHCLPPQLEASNHDGPVGPVFFFDLIDFSLDHDAFDRAPCFRGYHNFHSQ